MKISTFSRHIGILPSGNDLNIGGYTLKSNYEGKKIYIQGGIHGGEVTIWIIQNIFNYLRKNPFKGEVTIIPIANPAGWNQRVYFSTTGKFDLYMGKDWNRNFPGARDGTLGQRISKILFTEAKKADLVIDLHTSRESNPFGIIGCKNDLKLAKTAGFEYNFLIDTIFDSNYHHYKSSLLGQLCKINKPNITIECGEHDSYNYKNIEDVTNAILRLLIIFDVIDVENISKGKTAKYFTKLKKYRAVSGGFIKFLKGTGEDYKKGEQLYEILNPSLLKSPIKILAEESGIIQKISPTHIFIPGDDVLEIIKADDIKII